MKLLDVLREECVVGNAKPADKTAALQQIAKVAKKSPVLKGVSETEIVKGLEERESLGSTGFGRGIAIPHCRLKSAKDFVVGILTVPSGVEFDALDGEKARLLVFIIAPEEQSNSHIRLLCSISQTLAVPGAVDEILAVAEPHAIVESFLRHSRADIDTTDVKNKSIIHLFVQDEDKFHELVHALGGAEASSMVVLSAENAGVYLSRMPMFAGFWTDNPERFSRLIVTVVDRKLTNEILRRIETIAGNLNETTGVMVTVQDISYSAGSLEA
jgi:PTS system nitrogen regulatory IIA component